MSGGLRPAVLLFGVAVLAMNPAPSFPGVFADDSGNVWSSNTGKMRRLSPALGGNGYLVVTLRRPRLRTVLIHAIVCEAFHGPRPSQHTVAHMNGDRTDNRPSNLQWATMKEQTRHKWLHGTMPCGDKSHMSKVPDVEWLKILDRVRLGESQASIAREYGITPQAVWHVVRGKARRHLTSKIGDLLNA